MSKTVLVVGGAGYVGSHINKLLFQSGYDTVIYDNLSCGHERAVKWGQLVPGDLADKEDLRRLFHNFDFSAVMHFAAFTNVGESVNDPAKYYLNNVANTLNLLEAMRAAGCLKFVFSSTCAVYGQPVSLPLSEDHPQNPISPYGVTKQIVEKMLENYSAAYGFQYVALRYFNAAGADPESDIGEDHAPETHLIPLALAAAAGRRELTIYGDDYDTPDGTCIRDYIHVNDLAEAHIMAMEYIFNEGSSRAFNLGNGQGYSVKEVIDCAAKVTGRAIKPIMAGRRPGDPPILVGSAGQAHKILGWKPQLADLETIISTAWQWHKRQCGN